MTRLHNDAQDTFCFKPITLCFLSNVSTVTRLSYIQCIYKSTASHTWSECIWLRMQMRSPNIMCYTLCQTSNNVAQGGISVIEGCCQIWSLPIHQPTVWSLVLCQHTSLEWSLLQQLLQITYISVSFLLECHSTNCTFLVVNLRYQSSLGQGVYTILVKIKWLLSA